MQTSIEWLVEQIEQYILTYGNLPFNVLSKFKEQAKEMHKQEIIDAVNITSKNCVNISNKVISKFTKIDGELFMHDEKDGEQYYQKTFKK